MAVSEAQLERWSHQGSVQQSAATYESIRKVLNDPGAPYANRTFKVFLQGSYGNDTNVYAESDVDIVICLTSVFYSDINGLSADDTARYDANRSPGNYSFDQFKREVTDWLKVNFGNGVNAGKKAIFVPGNNGRRDSDVLACVEHRDYYSYPAYGNPDFHEGICFWTSDGVKIVNYPKQHMANCTSKRGATSNRFKPNIRAIKNMRNTMVNDRYLADGVAPSYFLEGMFYNVPSQNFVWNYQQSFENAIGWIEMCDPTQLVCANERYYLIRDGSNVCWNMKDFRATIAALRLYWNSSGR
jgi:hypothetical protein